MMKRSLVLGFILVVMSSPVLANEIVLKNPDFEQARKGRRLPGWSMTQHAGVPAFEVGLDAEVAAKGKTSARVRRTEPQVYGYLKQVVEVADLAGKEIEFKASVRTRDVGKKGWVMVMIFTNHGAILDQIRSKPMHGNVDWRKITLVRKAPPMTNRIEVGFMLLDGGTGWADDVSLRALEPKVASKPDKPTKAVKAGANPSG